MGPAQHRVGTSASRTKDYEKALAEFEKLLTLPSKDERPYQVGKTEAYYQIGKTCLLAGRRLDRDEEAFTLYLKSKPNFFMPSLAWAHIRLGNIYAKKGDRPRARFEYEAALSGTRQQRCQNGSQEPMSRRRRRAKPFFERAKFVAVAL